MFSGGKDSVYAIMKMWKPDILIYFIYDFPRPSPHTINMGKMIELASLLDIPIIVKKLHKNYEHIEAANFLKKLNTNEIIAGDIYLDRNYLEAVSHECNATLYEPLWLRNPEDLLREEINEGIQPLIIGTVLKMKKWCGKVINKDNIEDFIKDAKMNNIDPAGEKGEYHTLVLDSPLQFKRLKFKRIIKKKYNDYIIAKLI